MLNDSQASGGGSFHQYLGASPDRVNGGILILFECCRRHNQLQLVLSTASQIGGSHLYGTFQESRQNGFPIMVVQLDNAKEFLFHSPWFESLGIVHY